MPRVIDKENVVNTLDNAPDKLRAVLGKYINSSGEVTSFQSDKINHSFISPNVEENNQVLIPSKKQRIFISGVRSGFRNHLQWEQFLFNTINTGVTNLDHTSDAPSFEVTNTVSKNDHRPDYEDFTKVLPSNQLINYNLFSYKYKNDVEDIRNIADIRTRFDGSPPSLEDVFNQIGNRLDNYTGSVEEISTKQRNIFKLTNERDTSISDSNFPFVYSKTIQASESQTSPSFLANLKLHKKEKNLFQLISRDLSFSNRNFSIAGKTTTVKIYDVISLMTSTENIQFKIGNFETFLLGQNDLRSSSLSERFVNQLDLVIFLQKMRNFIKEGRDIEEIFNFETCQNFVLGYKIEKYLENDATSPIQTYYINDTNLKDTQIKYGSKYIYKTKALLGVLGSSYRYSNLIYTSSDSEMINESREIITSHPVEISQVSGEKYYAYVDVSISPSFKILEFEIEPVSNYLKQTAFVDSPTMMPHVSVYGNMQKPMVNFRLMPRFFTFGGIGQQEFGDQDILTRVGILRDSDARIANLFEISGEKIVNPNYFTGIYEVYRMERPPLSKSEFQNYYLTTVDSSNIVWLPNEQAPVINNDMNALFTDKIVPNRKYYYAFRSLTYHGTPSELTEIFEVELLKDSDEYKINMKLYNIIENNEYTYKKNIKRIIRLIPNSDRLAFNNSESTQISEVNLGSVGTEQEANRLVDFDSPNTTRTFKLRVTSKHTGKKMDINISAKLIKSGF